MKHITHSLVAILLLIGFFASEVVAQIPPGAPKQQQKKMRNKNRQDRARRARGMRIMKMLMQRQQTPAIAIGNDYVFVVHGGTLYQFTIDGLKEIARVELAPALPKKKKARPAADGENPNRQPQLPAPPDQKE